MPSILERQRRISQLESELRQLVREQEQSLEEWAVAFVKERCSMDDWGLPELRAVFRAIEDRIRDIVNDDE